MLYPKSSCSRSGSSAATARGTARRCVSWGRSHALDVLEDDAQARLVGRVRTPAVEHLAAVEDDRSGGHHRVDDLVVALRSAVDPTMAARDDPRRAVLDREVVERPHRVHDDVGEVAGKRVDAGVVVEYLRLLTRADLDAGRCRQLVVAEHAVEHPEQQRIDRRARRTLGSSRRARRRDFVSKPSKSLRPNGKLVEHLRARRPSPLTTSSGDSIPSTMQYPSRRARRRRRRP